MKAVHFYPSLSTPKETKNDWLAWKRMSLTHQGGTPVSKIRSLKRKLYFEDEPKAAENPNDPAIKVAPIQVLKKLSIEQPVQEKPVKILKKTEPVLEDSLENSLNEYLANHAVTYLPPIDLINKVSNSPELKSDIKAQEIKLENPKVTFNIAFDADEDWEKIGNELFKGLLPKSYVKLNTESPRKPETFTIGELGLIGQHIPHRYFPKRERGPTRHYRQRSQHVRNLSPVYKEEPKLLSTTITTPRTTYNYSTPISLKSPYPLTRNDFYIMHNTPKPKKHYSPVILVEDEVRELEPIYNPRLTQTSHHKRDVSHVVNIGISTDS